MFFNLTYPNMNFSHKIDPKPKKIDDFCDHFHLIYEILYFIGGDAEFVIENKKFEVKPGHLLFIPPGYHHSITLDPNIPYERYVVKFPEYIIPCQLLPSIKTKSGCYTIENTELPLLFSRFDSHIQNYDGVDLSGLLKCVLMEILYYFCKDSKSYEYEVYDEKMIDVLNYINENIARKITLADICKHFHYSKSYICRKFMLCMNVPIMKYIRTKKILLAESLINNGVKPMQIFEQCGFSDYSTFYRAYKSLLGKSPTL